MSKHTPGLWEERADAHGRGRIYAGGAWIATTWLAPGDGNNSPQLPALANARLIAAAPDLLEALYTAEALLLSMGMQLSDAYQQIDAAIAKATGGQA